MYTFQHLFPHATKLTAQNPNPTSTISTHIFKPNTKYTAKHHVSYKCHIQITLPCAMCYSNNTHIVHFLFIKQKALIGHYRANRSFYLLLVSKRAFFILRHHKLLFSCITSFVVTVEMPKFSKLTMMNTEYFSVRLDW